MTAILCRPQCVKTRYTKPCHVLNCWPPGNSMALHLAFKAVSKACVIYYSDDIMGAIASQINSLTIVNSIVNSGADQRKHQSSASLAFVRGIHRRPVNSLHKWPVTRKSFHLMMSSCYSLSQAVPSLAWSHLIQQGSKTQHFNQFFSKMQMIMPMLDVSHFFQPQWASAQFSNYCVNNIMIILCDQNCAYWWPSHL